MVCGLGVHTIYEIYITYGSKAKAKDISWHKQGYFQSNSFTLEPC